MAKIEQTINRYEDNRDRYFLLLTLSVILECAISQESVGNWGVYAQKGLGILLFLISCCLLYNSYKVKDLSKWKRRLGIFLGIFGIIYAIIISFT
jgi:hypothetical protein